MKESTRQIRVRASTYEVLKSAAESSQCSLTDYIEAALRGHVTPKLPAQPLVDAK